MVSFENGVAFWVNGDIRNHELVVWNGDLEA